MIVPLVTVIRPEIKVLVILLAFVLRCCLIASFIEFKDLRRSIIIEFEIVIVEQQSVVIA